MFVNKLLRHVCQGYEVAVVRDILFYDEIVEVGYCLLDANYKASQHCMLEEWLKGFVSYNMALLFTYVWIPLSEYSVCASLNTRSVFWY